MFMITIRLNSNYISFPLPIPNQHVPFFVFVDHQEHIRKTVSCILIVDQFVWIPIVVINIAYCIIHQMIPYKIR